MSKAIVSITRKPNASKQFTEVLALPRKGRAMPRRLRALLSFAAAALFAGQALGQTTVALQQGQNAYAGTIDAKVACCTFANTVYGSDTYSSLIVDTSTSLLVRFAIFQSEGGPVPNGATITSATLSLFKDWGPDAVFKATRILKNWNETATWNATGTGPAWTTPGVFTGDLAATVDGQASVAANNGCDLNANWPSTCWLNVDVTPGVQAFAGGTSNFGWKLSYVSGSNDSGPKEFYSRDNTQFPQLRPKLTISYTTSTTPTVPTARLTASPTVGTGPLAVTFGASTSTDGGSPITGLRLQFGDGTPDATWTDKNAPIPPHTYAAASTTYTATATLTVSNAVGPSAPSSVQITVNPAPGPTGPTARLTVDHPSGTEPLDVLFDASTSAQGTAAITQLRLAFDDGSPDDVWNDKALKRPHTYAARATPYNAVLTVTDANNLTSTSQVQVTVSTSGTIPPSITLGGRGVATFHSIGLYWEPGSFAPPVVNGVQLGVPVQYRKANDATWHRGYDMVYDTRAFTVDGAALEKARGSIVHLDPNTPYVIQFGTYDTAGNVSGWVRETHVSTWNETFAVQGTTFLPATLSSLSITSGGRETTGYQVYDGAQPDGTKTRITASSSTFGIQISASYVIVRNVIVIGGSDGIRIDDNMTDVVIEKSDISGWGSASSGRFQPAPYSSNQIGANEQAGIRTTPGNSATQHRGIRHIVIQNNKIHDPQFSSNFDPFGRDGPKGIDMTDTGGNNVIRYNEIYVTNGDGSPAHYMQDGISGSTNDSQQGAPGQDSDIYMNRVQHCVDDGIEAEGGGMNVRVWKNYTDMCAVGIATSSVSIGPTYVWRNVENRSRKRWAQTWTSDERGQAYKSGTFAGGGNGRRHMFHNLVMQFPDASLGRLGHAGGIQGNTNEPTTNTVSRNNVYLDFHVGGTPYSQIGTGNDFDYDVAESYSGAPVYAHPLQGTPAFQPNNGPTVFDGGMYQLAPSSVGHDTGVPLFNFNHDIAPAPFEFVGAGPDAGAHEDGAPRMVFGTSASGS